MLLLITLMFYYGNNYNPEIQVGASGMTVNSAAAITIPSLMNGPRAGINVGKFKKGADALRVPNHPSPPFCRIFLLLQIRHWCSRALFRELLFFCPSYLFLAAVFYVQLDSCVLT